MKLLYIGTPELIIVGLWLIAVITGLLLVVKDNRIPALQKAIWTFAILIFNYVALLCLFVYRSARKKEGQK